MTTQRQTIVNTVVFIAIALVIGADVVADMKTGASPPHMVAELFVTITATVAAVVTFSRLWRETQRLRQLQADSKALLAGIGNTVEKQFGEWQLTPSEREVSLLLLKGFSFQEIASIRDTSERTAREQARNVYKKANVSGRAELSAWFLEDLL